MNNYGGITRCKMERTTNQQNYIGYRVFEVLKCCEKEIFSYYG